MRDIEDFGERVIERYIECGIFMLIGNFCLREVEDRVY